MPTLQIRNLPQDIFDKLAQSAKNSRRSLTQEAIIILEKALNNDVENQRIERKKKALERIRLLNKGIDISTSVEEVVQIIRDDRDNPHR